MQCAKLGNLATLFNRLYSSLSVLTVKETLKTKPIEAKILVQGWVRAVRKHKDNFFVDLVDGTCPERLQIVIEAKDSSCPTYGSSIKVEGSLIKSAHKGQDIELIAKHWSTLGTCPSSYPFKYHQRYSPEYIRQFLHLRPRTRKFSSVLRIRSCASSAIHNFFQNEGFCFVHTPVITTNDCEGAGDVFSIEFKGQMHEGLNSSVNAENTANIIENSVINGKNEQNIAKEFFDVPAYLTVSGQLHLEAMACALTKVYNFGPVFRAENSRTRQHASEFHMVEAELAFIETVGSLTEIVEKCIKEITKSIVNNCKLDINLLGENFNESEKYIERIISKPFVQMSYTDAVNILERSKDSLQTPMKWGDDLVADHKQFLINYCDNIPVFVCMFPSSLKPFYMKSDENKMAYCFDLFAPYGGEICGGSLRENSEEILKLHSDSENNGLSWYLDITKYGAVPHGGFGIGFDRLLQYILRIPNIRDVIPFPRRKHDCKC